MASKNKEEIIDLTHLNIFDAVNQIIMISNNHLTHNITQKVKCKVASSDISYLLKNIPLSKIVEFI